MRRIILTEEQLNNIILNESRPNLRSTKLANILKAHNGFGTYAGHKKADGNFSELRDDDIIGVMPYNQAVALRKGRRYANEWARGLGFEVRPTDSVESERLGDGNILIYIERNSFFDNTTPYTEGGYKEYVDKLNNRADNRRNDGKFNYQWKNKEKNF